MEHQDKILRLGERLRALRKEKGFSQENFARHVGIDRSYYGQIERGSRNVTVSNLYKICIALKIQPGDLLND